MKIENSLVSRIWGLILITVFIAGGLICTVSLIQSRSAIKQSIRQRMLDIVSCIAVSVDGDDMRRITSDAPDSPESRRISGTLAAYRNNPDIKYVYGVKAEDNGRFIYIADPDPQAPAGYGEELIGTEALRNAASGNADADKRHHTDDWGTFYSAYCPVFDHNGEVAGIIGADFTVRWYEEQLSDQTKQSITLYLNILCIVLVLVGVICYLQVGAITKSMDHITAVARRYEEGDYSEKLEVEREDEIGVLSRSLQAMAVSLTEQIKKSDEANRAKSDFLANMSHEIRTPINAVLGMNEMILREATGTDVLNYSENIRAAGNTLLGLINDILDFSKIESGKMEIIPVDYDLSSLINDLVNMILTRVEDKGLELKLELDPDIPRLLHGDEVRIRQIITNLLTNAAKYTEKGTVTLGMSYEQAESDPESIELRVAVRDTGIGIRPEDMDRLFSQFERIEEERNRNIEGTGLGLSITRSLLEMMGSSLLVESEYGKGSDFHFTLKQPVVSWEKLGDYEKSQRAYRNDHKKYRTGFTAPDAHILVVDDNLMNLMVFKGLVKQTCVQVDEADSGDECIRLSRMKKYDIIFLDHMMPKKDGIETLHEIRDEAGNPNRSTPTVCLTANAISGSREFYMEAGFDDYLSKPVDFVRLESLMLEYLPADKCREGFPVNGTDGEELRRAPESSPAASGAVPKAVPQALSEAVPQSIPEALKTIDGKRIDVALGINYIGSVEDYIPLLQIFYETIEENIELLNGYFEREDYKNYTIKMHSLKSSARVIGAGSLGEQALSLEKAAKAGDSEYLRSHHALFMEEYAQFREILSGLVNNQ